MTLAKGDKVWGARLYKDSQPDHWFEYTVSDPVGTEGGAAQVHRLEPFDLDPPLVAKLFKQDIRERIQKYPEYANRVLIPTLYWDNLYRDLGFAMWPRRALFDVKEPPSKVRGDHLVGFTMAMLKHTISLQDLIFSRRHMVQRLVPDRKTVYFLCSRIADQVAQMHRHPWGFVFGDMSPHNIHVSDDFTRVTFIDTDSFQFTAGKGRYPFRLYGITPSYTSPGAYRIIDDNKMVTPAHDDFVLAILIFLMLSSELGNVCHPFNSPEGSEDELIERKYFPFETSPPNVADDNLETYRSMPAPIREAFKKTFTGATPVTAAEWADLIETQRRSLWRSS